ncbi:MAG: flagellar protein FlaG [Candidatus Krumholzibacteriota bacterium]|nr:flagellar protein FlaG [Candidatus Krumholzibacteriota bacterium]
MEIKYNDPSVRAGSDSASRQKAAIEAKKFELKVRKLNPALEKAIDRTRLENREKKSTVQQVDHSVSEKHSVETRELAYKKHPGTNKYYVRVQDAETKEIVREIPPPEELDRIARLVKYLQANFGI